MVFRVAGSPTYTDYVVKRGDTLWDIAQKNSITLKQLLAANSQITNPNLIHVNDHVRLPVAPPKKLTGVGLQPLSGATLALPRTASKVQFLLSKDQLHQLPNEQERAYRVYEQLADAPGLVARLKVAVGVGNPKNAPAGTEMIGKMGVQNLAQACAAAGYPLTPEGLARFRAERGIDEDSIGPETARALVEEMVARTLVSSETTPSQHAFLANVAHAALVAMRDTGVPASVSLAQCILESDWGRAAAGNNYFGIKGTGPAGTVPVWTDEYSAGRWIHVQEDFRAYDTVQQSFIDHAELLSQGSDYAAAMKVANDPRAFARALQKAGYATDPSYAAKLISIMNQYNLYQFDKVINTIPV